VLFANQRFAQLLGVPLGELYRVPLAAYVGADDRAAVAALLTTPASDDAGIEVDLLARSGRVRARIAVVSSWEQYATLVVTDLAHERLVEEAQQTVDAIRRGEVEAFVIGGETVMMLGGGARDPYQVLADRIQQGALTLSSANKVIYANDKLARMLGVPVERLLGGEFAASVLPADRPVLRGLLDGKNGGQGEVRLRHADGSSVPMLVSMLPLADGRRMCLVTDLSERKRHQASDERNRKFLGMLAHEFRNMLATIHNAVEVLKQHELNAECTKALVLVERQSDRMLELVEDLRRVNPKP
jgi:PAS domain S-box-containing protein